MTGQPVDRKAIARALAKATAYAECGKAYDRDLWAGELLRLLGAAGIVKPEALRAIAVLDELRGVRP